MITPFSAILMILGWLGHQYLSHRNEALLNKIMFTFFAILFIIMLPMVYYSWNTSITIPEEFKKDIERQISQDLKNIDLNKAPQDLLEKYFKDERIHSVKLSYDKCLQEKTMSSFTYLVMWPHSDDACENSVSWKNEFVKAKKVNYSTIMYRQTDKHFKVFIRYYVPEKYIASVGDKEVFGTKVFQLEQSMPWLFSVRGGVSYE